MEVASRGADDSDLRAILGLGFDHAALAMLLIDECQDIVCANPAAGKMLETEPLAGRSIVDFRTGSSVGMGERSAAAFLAGDRFHLEHDAQLLTGTGRTIWAELIIDTLQAIPNRRYFLMQLRDVTENRRNQAGLTTSELRYRQLVQNLPNMSVMTFDTDLRLSVVAGELLDRSGYDGPTMAGRLIADVLPAKAFARLEGPLRAAAAGQPADLEYSSPINGRQYRLRLRPVTSADGHRTGGLALSEDVSADRVRQSQLEQVQELSLVGSCWYDRSVGWSFDRMLLQLIGVDQSEDALASIRELLVDEDRPALVNAYRQLFETGGRITLQFRIRHGRTGEVRHVLNACEAVVDSEGELMRAMSTLADTTEVINAQQSAERLRAAAAEERTTLLRRVSDVLAVESSSLVDVLQATTDIAAAAAGDGAVLRVLSTDGRAVERDVVSHRDPVARAAISQFLAAMAGRFDPAGGMHGEVLARGGLISSIGNAGWRAELVDRIGDQSIRPDVEHFVFAPVRHEGKVLGFLHVFRSDPAAPFEAGDDDLVQVLADRVGSAIAESRVRQVVETQRKAGMAVQQRLIELTVEQRELLDQLAGVEERERTLLAEAIHDEPLQLIVSAIMHLDILGTQTPVPRSADLAGIADTLERSVEKLRTLIIAITPPDLSGGLGPALRNLAEGIFVGTSARVDLVGSSHVGLSTTSTQTAYRVMREGLVNARKHSHAQNIALKLDQDQQSVSIALSDDGVGAATLDAGPGHFGLPTMRARAAGEGGDLRIHTEPGKGLTVVLTLPKQRRSGPSEDRRS